MKKILSLAIALALGFSTAFAQKHKVPTEQDMGAYVMVYHKDFDHSLHMAPSSSSTATLGSA